MSRPLLILLALATLAGAARGAPLPRPLPSRANALPTGRSEAVCGAGLQDASDLLRAHFAQPARVLQATPYSLDHGHVAVLEDDGTFFYTTKNNDVIADPTAIAQAFYRTHGDDYDHLAIYLTSGLSTFLGSSTALAASFVIRNPTLGIGLSTFDVGAGFGSPARLEDICSMNGLHRYLDDPWASSDADSFTALDFLAHEFGHRWLAYIAIDSAGTTSNALLGRDRQHWSFFADVDGSIMEGADWAQVGPDSFRTVAVTTGYGRLDQYLMGLRPTSAIDPWFTLGGPTDFDPPGTYNRTTDPFVGLGCRAQANPWTIAQVVTANGPRVPDAASAPHAFRCAIILVTPQGADATPHDLAKTDSIARAFEQYFPLATGGLGTMRTDLDSRFGPITFAHDPLADVETSAPRDVGARVFVGAGSKPMAIDPAAVQVWYRTGGSGPFTAVPMSAAGPDSFAATLPGLAPGGTGQYYLSAASDSGLTATFPAAGAAAPFTWHVGPDAVPPVIVHTPVTRQGVARLPQRLIARVTDNLGVDSVWVEARIDGGAVSGVSATPAGRDSFAATVGAGLAPGQQLAYRFVARDRATAHNVTYSNAAFDTLRVQQDWVDEFENGDDGFFHQAYWYSYRDAWHLSQRESSPSGGTAWMCGRDDSLGYAPHLDANLYTPLINGITAATRLQFDHTYALEDNGDSHAWDGARLEVSVNGGAWQVLPMASYDHTFIVNSNPFQAGTPCWSGTGGWRTDVADLSPYAPGPVRVRFRMLADDLVGYSGWTVDRIRLLFNGASSVPVTLGRVAMSPPWPNPARAAVHLSGALPAATHVRWSLYDPAGRRVGVLWQGTRPGGPFTLAGTIPAVHAGLYFARLETDGRILASSRLAIVR